MAFAAKRFYQSLMQQGPSSMQKYYQGQVSYWDAESKQRAYKFAMKQTPVTKVQH